MAKKETSLQDIIEIIKNAVIQCEQKAEEEIKTKNRNYDPTGCVAGWYNKVDIHWDQTYRNATNVHLEWDYGSAVVSSIEGMPNIANIITDQEMFEKEVSEPVREWFRERHNGQPFGSLYAAKVNLEVEITVERGKGINYKKTNYRAYYKKLTNEQLLSTQQEKTRQYILNKEYEKYDWIDTINPLGRFCMAAGEMVDEFGAEKLIEILDVLVKKIIDYYTAEDEKESISDEVEDLCEGFYNFAIYSSFWDKNADQITDHQKDLVFHTSYTQIMHGDSDCGKHYLNKLNGVGYKKAKELIKFGSGKIDRKHTYFKDKTIECVANDVTKVINLKIKEETGEVYQTLMSFILNAIKNGFPYDYTIKINSKQKNYLPFSLPKSKTHLFFANCAQYSEIHSLMAEYIRKVSSSFKYYGDAEDDEAVECGGYAAFALANCGREHIEAVVHFIQNSDLEHAITTRYFLEEYDGECSDELEEYQD